jgi:hypothetical protein
MGQPRIQSMVGPTTAPLSWVSASPLVNISMSLTIVDAGQEDGVGGWDAQRSLIPQSHPVDGPVCMSIPLQGHGDHYAKVSWSGVDVMGWVRTTRVASLSSRYITASYNHLVFILILVVVDPSPATSTCRRKENLPSLSKVTEIIT